MRSSFEQAETKDEKALGYVPRSGEVEAFERAHPDSIVAVAQEGLHHVVACMVVPTMDRIDLG